MSQNFEKVNVTKLVEILLFLQQIDLQQKVTNYFNKNHVTTRPMHF
jgi:hypothetical protein